MSDQIIANGVTARNVADQIVTAIEGGCGYWMADFLLISSANEPTSSPWYDSESVYAGDFKIEVREIDGQKHEFDQEKLKKGVALLAEKYPDRLEEIVEETGDAETADVLIQMALFGEIVYG